MREMGRRSEAADHPFRAMGPDDAGAPWPAAPALANLAHLARPVVLIERAGQRDIITSACPIARALGLHPGMAAAHARALVTDLDVSDATPGDDRAWLDRLALHAARHWTPVASVSPPDGLWLELTGTTHLFGGEESFCRRVVRFLAHLGFTAHIAIAGTPGAAHALARFAGKPIIVLPGGTETHAIAQLPLAALRLSDEALGSAARFGLERIGDLYPIARGPLARRLGLRTVERLDQARGLAAEPIVAIVPFAAPYSERRLLEPISTADAINQVIGDLADDLVRELERRRLGLRTAALTCTRVDAVEQRLVIGTAGATRDARHLARMFAMRVERIDPGLGIEVMRLVAPRVEDLQPVMIGTFPGPDGREPDLAPLVDQLAGRAGEKALFRIGPVESDVPERAVRRAPPLALPQGWPQWRRPVRLLPHPEPLSGVVALMPDHPPRRFAWRGTLYKVAIGEGPERVHGEWWRSAREMWAVRDYFMVETDGGERFWLFRRGDGLDAPTGDLSWYIHGVFG
nr:DNA polymerase Y family protein [Novosphingobium kaempferiae]